MRAVAVFRVAPAYVLLCRASSVFAGQIPLHTIPSEDGKVLITPQLSAFVEDVLEAASIPGLSMGVVRLDKNRSPIAEHGSWGKQTEDYDGNDLTPDVSTSDCLVCTHV